jgi:hypothetical protein
MKGFKGQFTRIKGVSDRRRLPRLGRIRLGVKVIHKTKGTEYPKETEHFVVPPEVAAKFGETPTELKVRLPVNDVDVVFPQHYAMYGKTRGVKCMGDGESALRANEAGEFEPRGCPCEFLETGDCQRRAHLMVMLPDVNVGGVYQVDTGSWHSIVDINSYLEWLESTVGYFAMVPLILKREPRDTHANGGKQKHYTLRLELDMSEIVMKDRPQIEGINVLKEDRNRVLSAPTYDVPPPEDINPAMDEGAVVEVIDEEDETPKAEEATAENVKEAFGDALEDPPGEQEKNSQKGKGAPAAAIKQLCKTAAQNVIDANQTTIKVTIPGKITIEQVNTLLTFLSVVRAKEPIEMAVWQDKVKEVTRAEEDEPMTPGDNSPPSEQDGFQF